MNEPLPLALFIHFLILQLSMPLFPPDVCMLLSHMPRCLPAVVLSLCVTRLTGLSLHTLSTSLTLALNPAVGSSSLLPCRALPRTALSFAG